MKPTPTRDPTRSLCESCVHVRIIESDRDSRFFRCRLAQEDPRYVKYPPQPVMACPGWKR